MKCIAFDLEIARVIPDGETDWKAHCPLGITCAATMTYGHFPALWHGGRHNNPAPKMNIVEVRRIISYLQSATRGGYTIVTWNGLGFDFNILAEESAGLLQQCKDLALNHIDLMFQFFCQTGFVLSLDRAAKGMGLAGKTAGMNGAMAPRLWQEGKFAEVTNYLLQDVRTTVDLAVAIQEAGHLEWISRSGKARRVEFPRLMTVRECLDLPLPDTSWMDNPWPREKFTAWLDMQGAYGGW